MNKLIILCILLLVTLYNYSQTANMPSPIQVCSHTGIVELDLSTKNAEVLGTQNPNDFIVSYHSTQIEAETGVNALTNPYVNTSITETIYIRVEEIATGNFDTTTLELIVSAYPYSDIFYFIFCGYNDYDWVDVSGVTETLEGDSSTNAHEVKYYETYEDAENETNEIDMESLGDLYPVFSNNQYNSYYYDEYVTVLYVSATNTVTGCRNYSSEVIIMFDYIETDSFYIENDIIIEAYDSDNDGFAIFDLSESDCFIISNYDPSSHTSYNASYHSTFNDANNNTNALPTLYINTQTETETVYMRLESTEYYNTTVSGQDCFIVKEIQLKTHNYAPATVVCGVPLNTTFCYDNNETERYVFTSSDGNPLKVRFNSGMLENNIDKLVVLDSYCVENLYPYGNGNQGDLSGLTFQSSGDTITVYIDSNDSIIGCTNEPIDFTVSCLAETIGTIKVNAFLDNNNDGVFNEEDIPFTKGFFTYEKNNNGNVYTVNSNTEDFTIYNHDIETNSYDIGFNIYNNYQSCYSLPTSLFENVMVDNGDTIEVNFPITNQTSCEDLAVYLLEPSPRLGFDHISTLKIGNRGNTTISGSVMFTHDSLIDFNEVINLSSNYTITPNDTGFVLDFVNLEPGSSSGIRISLHTPSTLDLGELITNTAEYITASNDIILANNISTSTTKVIAAFDPNDIMEAHGPSIDYESFSNSDEYLYYTIRFQNIGTAEAINVRIENTVDALLDISTVELLDSSHDTVMTINNNQLIWTFNYINLPAEFEDEEGSNGYVYFKIKPTAGYTVETEIPNTAEIYFDFNAPVITNTFNTNFTTPNLSVEAFNTETFIVYPNPVSDLLTIDFNTKLNKDVSVTLYNIQGQEVVSKIKSKAIKAIQIDVKDLKSGIYFISIKDKEKQTIKKIIIN